MRSSEYEQRFELYNIDQANQGDKQAQMWVNIPTIKSVRIKVSSSLDFSKDTATLRSST